MASSTRLPCDLPCALPCACSQAVDDVADPTWGEDVLPRDRQSLEEERTRLRTLERTLALETADVLLDTWALVHARRQAHVGTAHAAHGRRVTAAHHVCAYLTDQAHATYRKRCRALQDAMAIDLDKELARLHAAKDGVSVTSRRRRTVRSDHARATATRETVAGARGLRGHGHEATHVERLLGRPSIFPPVVSVLTVQERQDDVEAMERAVRTRRRRQEGKKARRRTGTPRTVDAGVPWYRLRYNPRLVQEGQEVQVFKRQREDRAGQDECITSGILTAATRTHVYVLAPSGRFDAVNVRDCLGGSLYVQAVEPTE